MNSDKKTRVVPISLLESDRFLDRVLDRLSERGYPPTSALARWDLRAAILDALSDAKSENDA